VFCFLTGVAQIAPCLGSSDEDIRRLAVGAMLALLVDQAGKVAAVEVRTVLYCTVLYRTIPYRTVLLQLPLPPSLVALAISLAPIA
jgi:hypothetical protein